MKAYQVVEPGLPLIENEFETPTPHQTTKPARSDVHCVGIGSIKINLRSTRPSFAEMLPLFHYRDLGFVFFVFTKTIF